MCVYGLRADPCVYMRAGVCVRSEGTDCDCSLWVLAFGAGSARSGQEGI